MDTWIVRVEYWTLPDGSFSGEEPIGIEEFRQEVENNYPLYMRGQSGACGGLYELTVEVMSNVSVSDFLEFVATGGAWDVLKVGVKAFILSPLVLALKKLRDLNREKGLEVGNFKFSFRDSDVWIHSLPTVSALDMVKDVFEKLATVHIDMRNDQGNLPGEIRVPVFKDPEPVFCSFRTLLDVDEIIENTSRGDYFKYWGVYYYLEGKRKIYVVEQARMLDIGYLTTREFWEEWSKRPEKARLYGQKDTRPAP
jgi:hypothetical protein